MLDTETKRRIDTARDILVGKLPDPKSQVEQITIALIYKFMDDIDKQSEELGGKPSFFKGEYSKYSWSKIFDSRLSGFEMFGLYSEAITRISQNPNIPQLFRDIFKNAYLPYRDPETLKSFLKIINNFHYDHSEKLGDAFEYLLSVMGSQGDAGQFRTPRHIIDFIVKVIDPKKNETILDPACGTAGFLISAYKNILEKNKDESGRLKLTPEEREKLVDNFVGYDISPDMVRLSLVNLYLHGFQNPHINEYDTLTSEEKWNDLFDVVLANHPFMTPKGGIKPHKRFAIQANRSEVLFVDYIAEHLTTNGRAGIIVPEGVIENNPTAYKNLRKILIEKYLYAVISLPAGVFNPYSGVKTSILLLDKNVSKKTNKVLFVKIENDGFDLGAQRRELKNSELPIALNVLNNYRLHILEGKEPVFEKNGVSAHTIDKSKLLENGDCNLSGDKYLETPKAKKQKFEMVELGEVLNYEQPAEYIVKSADYNDKYNTPVLTAGKTFILGYTYEQDGIFEKENLPVIIYDDFTTAIKFVDFPFKVKSSAMKILSANKEKADIRFLFYVMQKINFQVRKHKRHWISEYAKIKIPLPPLEVQKEIIAKIDEKQKIINNAKELISNLEKERTNSREVFERLKCDWVELGEACEILDSKRKPVEKSLRNKGVYPYYGATGIVDYINEYIFDERLVLIGEDGAKWESGDQTAFIAEGKYWVNNHAHVLRTIKSKLIDSFLVYYINALNLLPHITGVTVPKLNQENLRKIKIPLPDLETQKQLVARFDKQEEAIKANKALIEVMQENINENISEIWSEDGQ